MTDHQTRGSSGGTDTVRTNPHQAINPPGETVIEKRLRRQREREATATFRRLERERRAALLAEMEDEA